MLACKSLDVLKKASVLQDTWQEMEKLVDDGLVKSIGISNFSCKKIDALLEYARIKPVAVQVEVHPYFRNQKLMDHCKAKVWHSSYASIPSASCIFAILWCITYACRPYMHALPADADACRPYLHALPADADACRCVMASSCCLQNCYDVHDNNIVL